LSVSHNRIGLPGGRGIPARKKQVKRSSYLSLVPALPPHVTLVRTKRSFACRQAVASCEIGNTCDERHTVPMSPEMYFLLDRANGELELAA
jgi:hypothetical protein